MNWEKVVRDWLFIWEKCSAEKCRCKSGERKEQKRGNKAYNQSYLRVPVKQPCAWSPQPEQENKPNTFF